MAQIKENSTAGGSLIMTDTNLFDYNVSSNTVNFSTGYNFEINVINAITLYTSNLQVGQKGVIKIINNSHQLVSFSDVLDNNLRSTISAGGTTLLEYNIINSAEVIINIIEKDSKFDLAISKAVLNSQMSVVSSPQAIEFNTTGTKFYVLKISDLYEYDLGTPWVLSTAVNNGATVALDETSAGTGMAFNNDGTKFFLVGLINDRIYEYNVNVAWDVTSIVYTGVSFSTTSQEDAPTGIAFKNDGSKMYITGTDTDTVYEYNLSVNYSLASAVYSVSKNIQSEELTPRDVAFSSDGTKMYIAGGQSDKILEYKLSTPWLITTAVYNNVYLSMVSIDGAPEGIVFNINGSKMYIVGDVNDSAYEFIIK